MKNFPQFCGIEQEGEWFEIYFYDRIVDEVAVPIKMSIPMCRLKSHFEAQTCQEHNYGYYEDELPITTFDELVNDLHCRSDRDRYLKEIVRGIVSDKEEVKQLRRDKEKLESAYTDLLHMYNLKQGAPVPGAVPMPDLGNTMFQIHRNHIEGISKKEEERKELTPDQEHFKEVYQEFYPAYIPRQANS